MIESVRSTHIKELRGRRDLLVSQTAATVLKNEVTAIKLASAAESGKGSERWKIKNNDLFKKQNAPHNIIA